MQHQSHAHNPFEHTDTVVSTYRTTTYGDGDSGRCAPGGVDATCLFSRRLAGLVLYAGPHRLTYSRSECRVSDRTTTAARLFVDAGCLDGTVHGVRLLNERALAGIQDLCDGNLCERVQIAAFGDELIRMTTWGREHIQVRWWLCGEPQQKKALRQPAGGVPLTERTTFNLLHKMHRDAWDCRETILTSAKLQDTPRHKPGGSLLFHFCTSEETLLTWYLITLLSCAGCINGLEVQHGLTDSDYKYLVTGEMPHPRKCRRILHFGMGEKMVATEAHKPRKVSSGLPSTGAHRYQLGQFRTTRNWGPAEADRASTHLGTSRPQRGEWDDLNDMSTIQTEQDLDLWDPAWATGSDTSALSSTDAPPHWNSVA